MYCPNSSDTNNTKSATLVFRLEDLLYDIANMAYVEGDVMTTEEPHDRHQIMDVIQKGNVDRIVRILDVALGEISVAMRKFFKDSSCDGEVLTDKLTYTKNYSIELTLPEDFPSQALKALEALIHEYMVDRALADWLSVTKPTAAENWSLKVAEILEKIKDTQNSSISRKRITLHPY